MAVTEAAEDMRSTALVAQHEAAGARLVPFAGYRMPVQYRDGILAEHAWTRRHAGLFDVSHMGQALLAGPDFETSARALEMLVPADVLGLKSGGQRYTQLLNEEGGIADDLMVARPADPARDGEIFLVVNAATKYADYRRLAAALPEGIALHPSEDRVLLALQGPEAEAALARLAPAVAALSFMTGAEVTLLGAPAHVTRSGYTGEDGFEISLRAEAAGELWAALLTDERVRPIGLGARDSLRLEAGLPLYGHDINGETSPVEAGLSWSIGRRRRVAGDYPGAIRIAGELADGPLRRRVGIRVEGRVPAREHADILDEAGTLVGRVTSGGFGPTVEGPVAMGYVVAEFAPPGTRLGLRIRDRVAAGVVVPLPFVRHRYKR